MKNELKSARFIFSAEPSMLIRIDKWRAKHSPIPTRAEAVRRLIEKGLSSE